MGENCELEEGEIMDCSSNEAVVDLDVDLSYIDKKVHSVLGHLQKDFGEGALNMFGPKICDYGSFLPTNKHLLPIPSNQRISLSNPSVQRFSNNLPGKNVFQALPATTCKLICNQDPQNYQTSGSLLVQAPGKTPIKKGNPRIPGNDLPDHKPIRIRIKMGSEILSQKVVMVCKDLGLNNSSKSPPRNSSDDSSRMLPHTSLQKTSESPSRILQEMTTIPVPEDLLMSPLPDSLLLVKDKEKLYTLLDNQPVLTAGNKPSIKTHKKFSDVLGCEETPYGRRRKAVDCFDVTNWNESSSIGVMKKQKVISTGQLAWEKSTCGLGGACSTNDGLNTKSNLHAGIKRNGENDPGVAYAKSNKIKGIGSQIKDTKKTKGNKHVSDGSKHIKTGDNNKLAIDIKAEEIHLELNPAERKTKRHDNDSYTLDVEQDTKKRLLASKKKPDRKPQLTTSSGSLCTKLHSRVNSPVRKIRLMGYKQGKNGNISKLFTDGEEKVPIIEKAMTTKISVQESKAHQRNELFRADGSQGHRNADASCRYFSGGSGQISGVVTSISSKVLGSHKSGRMYVEEVKACPVESVFTYPARSSCPANLASAGESISWKNQNVKYGGAGSRIVNNGKPLSQEANCENLLTTHPRNRKQPKPEVRKQNSMFGDLPCTSMKAVLENRVGIKNYSAVTHETMDRSCQAANVILQEAEKRRKLADCLKISGYDHEYKEANFNAALRFLLGASLLEMCSTDNVEGGKMSHVEAYRSAAKLSESCAHEYETSQEMAAAALAYKCTEVACMRLVYGRSLCLSGEWNDLQKIVQMTTQGESPSSSASDVDSFNHQGVTEKLAKTKRGLSHVSGDLLPVARSQVNFVSLLDFTESMNLAMEASAKSQNAFRAVNVTSEETKHGDCISAIKKVIDFSFHDVEALIQMIEVAMDALNSSRFGGPKF